MTDLRTAAMFGALTDMMREFARLASTHSRQVVVELNDGLSQGWILKAEFAIGGAGPLALRLVAVSPLGTTVEVVNIDAPPSAQPFRLSESEPPHETS